MNEKEQEYLEEQARAIEQVKPQIELQQWAFKESSVLKLLQTNHFKTSFADFAAAQSGVLGLLKNQNTFLAHFKSQYELPEFITSGFHTVFSQVASQLQTAELALGVLAREGVAANLSLAALAYAPKAVAFLNCEIPSLQSIAGVQSTLFSLKKISPNLFNFEDIYSDSYKALYEEELSDEDQILFSEDSLEIVCNCDGKENHLTNLKDTSTLRFLFPDIKKSDIVDFMNHLQEFPMLGTFHDTGRIIYDRILSWVKKSQLLIENGAYYRSRLWEDEQEEDYSKLEMWQAPFGIPDIGRFNLHGMNLLYFADSKETAHAETEDAPSTIMRFHSKDSLHLLDLTESNCILFEFCNKKKTSSGRTPREYLIPNFISQCCCYINKTTKFRIDGIKYKSTINKDGYCFVLFEKGKDSFEKEKILVQGEDY